MSWFLAAVGFILLIIFHELGHFTAAKAVGMRVERFSLFFPPLLYRKKIGETEYAIGAIPAGGYVKISGMNPSEELSDEARTRAYWSQPLWKRMVVISAGPAVNLVIGFVLLVLFAWLIGPRGDSHLVGSVQRAYPAYGQVQKGDRLIKVDGRTGTSTQLSNRINAHKCATQPPTSLCKAAVPATITVLRSGHQVNIRLTPVYDPQTKRMRVGFSYDPSGGSREPFSFEQSVTRSGTLFWDLTKATVSIPAKILNPQERKQIHGIVGNYEVTRQTILHDPGDVIYVMAVISLALAIVNLFPFLPLDGGHIFWGIVEKIRRRPVSFGTMERSGFVGFAVVMMLFFIGLSNDITTLSNGGFKVP